MNESLKPGSKWVDKGTGKVTTITEVFPDAIGEDGIVHVDNYQYGWSAQTFLMYHELVLSESAIVLLINSSDPTIMTAAIIADYIFPGMDQLTYPMQGMIIHSLILDGDGDDPYWNMEVITVENGTKHGWEIQRRSNYSETLEYAKGLIIMHREWGVEK